MSHITNLQFLEYWFDHYLSLGYDVEQAVLLAEQQLINN